MINFVIVDDIKLHRKRIYNSILNNMMNNKIDFKIYEFDDYNSRLEYYIKKNNSSSIYILDLELPSCDGIEIAKLIRKKYNDYNSPIIIITIHTSKYYEVYKQRLNILDFIGKNDKTEKYLSENIDICLKMLGKEKAYRYTYKGVEYTIILNNIDYIQRDGRKIKIVTNNEKYYQNISINDIRKILPNYFVLSSKGVLINIKNVEKIDWNILKVFFKDSNNGYLVSKSHRKEIASHEIYL